MLLPTPLNFDLEYVPPSTESAQTYIEESDDNVQNPETS